MRIEWESAPVVADQVGAELFGTNMLFDRDRVGPDGTFDDAIEHLSIDHVRYPGGSITEWYFDITNPDAREVWAIDREDWREIMPLSEFLGWAGDAGVGVTLVVPTSSLLAPGDLGTRSPKDSAYSDIYTFITEVLSGVYGDADIRAFEMGNEYWLEGRMTQHEYSAISNVMAEAIQDAIDDHRAREGLGPDWQEPDIVMQVGQSGKYSPDDGYLQHNYLVANATEEAAAAIDGIVFHYYVQKGWEYIPSNFWYFERIEQWEQTFDVDLDIYVTEWNVLDANTELLGLRQASSMWAMFADMVVEGVDTAHIWPAQQNNRSDLAGNEGSTDLTIAGEAFRMLSEVLVGADLTRRTQWDSGVVTAWFYENDDDTHIYITSQSESAERYFIDINELGLVGQEWSRTVLGSDSTPDDWEADPVVTFDAGLVAEAGGVWVDLAPWEVARLSFDGEGDGIGEADPDYPTHQSDDDGQEPGTGQGDDTGDDGGSEAGSANATEGADRLTGTEGDDTLSGLAGDDTIQGGAGRDLIDAGDGNDLVTPGLGADRVFLGAGNDRFTDNDEDGKAGADKVFGGDGDDELSGAGGGDSLSGDAGRDTISGGEGPDVISGGNGGDVAWGGPGDDEISGDAGRDSLRGGDGDDTIRGGEGNDTIQGDGDHDVLSGDAGQDSLSGWTGDDLLLGGGGNDTLTGASGRDTLIGGDGDDLLIGGEWADTFVFDRDDGRDTIEGFSEEDVIDLRGQGVAWHEVKIDIVADTATVKIAGTHVHFTHLAADLDVSDFLFS